MVGDGIRVLFLEGEGGFAVETAGRFLIFHGIISDYRTNLDGRMIS